VLIHFFLFSRFFFLSVRSPNEPSPAVGRDFLFYWPSVFKSFLFLAGRPFFRVLARTFALALYVSFSL